ncbi:unnamed protein product [Urochloa humidicola]
METFLSAALGDLTSRFINFIINKYSKLPAHAMEENLQRAVIRAQVIINEAMQRAITNQAMLLQLNMLRDTMHRGHYVLDTFRYQPNDEEDAKDQSPYSMHLQLANCMFDRQMEAHLVVNFLLHVQPHGAEELEVLPIVGPSYVGKSTLVTHVCKDERVRTHFSEILFFHIQGFTDDELATFRDECELKYQNCLSESNLEARLLVVIELIGDLSEQAWGRLYSASKMYMPRASKIIVTSRFDSIVKFGTTQALTLKFLSREAYWYFFKTLTFGSMDPEMHPRLMHLAMEIAKATLGPRCHLTASIMAHLRKDNFDVKFWSKFLAFKRRSYQNFVSRSGEHPFDSPNQNIPILFQRKATPSEYIVLYHRRQHSLEEEIPKIKFQDLICERVKPHGKFEVLAWTSRIPPYYSCVYTCKIEGPKTKAVKRKRSMKNGVTNC